MSLRDYKEKFENFLEKREKYLEKRGRKVPEDISQLSTGEVRSVEASIMVFDIVNSTKKLKELGLKEYHNWLGSALHLFFHCVNDFGGYIDKYTGDGAMITFSIGSSEERCRRALECAFFFSKLLNCILNPYFHNNEYGDMYVRIGIDYGTISIEKIGKKEQKHLIILGKPANNAKKLEGLGRDYEFKDFTTICIGEKILRAINLGGLCEECFNEKFLIDSIYEDEIYLIYHIDCRHKNLIELIKV